VVGDSKYVVIFNPLQPDDVTQRMRNVLYGSLHRENALDPLQTNISG